MKLRNPFALYGLLFLCIVAISCRKHSFERANNQIGSRTSNSAPIVNPYLLPVRTTADFKWGVIGHPLTASAYTNNLSLQMSLLKELQVSTYRVEIPHNQQGEITDVNGFNALVNAATTNGITLVPVIALPADSILFALSAEDAFNKGKVLGKGFASRYKAQFDSYILGNQLDNKLIIGNNNGSQFSHYDYAKFEIVASFLKGMIEGIDEEESFPKYVINNGGDLHYPWFRMLMEAEVQYDIMGFHWYGTSGTPFANIVNLLNSNDYITRTAWFFINDKSTLAAGDLAANASQIELLIHRLDDKHQVRGLFIDELFDEPYLGTGNVESKMGLVAWDNPFASVTYRPAFNTYKRKIEESKRGFSDFVYALFLYVNQRQPDAGGLSYWTSQARFNNYHLGIVEQFFWEEAHGMFVDRTYQSLLNRGAGASEKQSWVDQLANGSEREDVIRSVADGTEFWSLSGSNYSGFVDRVYQRLLNRAATGAENNNWSNALIAGSVTKVQMVDSILKADEYLRAFVRAQYNDLLRRNGDIDAATESWAVGVMQNGMNQFDFMLTLIYSYEFWEKALAEGYERNNAPYTW